jgi:spore coat protein U-like protein
LTVGGAALLVPMSLEDVAATADAAQCTFEGAAVVAFGSYDPLSNASLEAQGRVSYRCLETLAAAPALRTSTPTQPTPGSGLLVRISLSTGNAGVFNRAMRGGVERLHYNLYLDATHQVVWGDGSAGTYVYSAPALLDNRVVVVPVYGRVFAGQDVTAGQYFDQILVTMDF